MPRFVISSSKRIRIWVFMHYLDLENFLKFFLGTKCTYVCTGWENFLKHNHAGGAPDSYSAHPDESKYGSISYEGAGGSIINMWQNWIWHTTLWPAQYILRVDPGFWTTSHRTIFVKIRAFDASRWDESNDIINHRKCCVKTGMTHPLPENWKVGLGRAKAGYPQRGGPGNNTRICCPSRGHYFENL